MPFLPKSPVFPFPREAQKRHGTAPPSRNDSCGISDRPPPEALTRRCRLRIRDHSNAWSGPSAPSRKYLGIRAPLQGAGPSLQLRCASCNEGDTPDYLGEKPRSVPPQPQSRAAARRGASTLSVRQAIYETVHEHRSLRGRKQGTGMRADHGRQALRGEAPRLPSAAFRNNGLL